MNFYLNDEFVGQKRKDVVVSNFDEFDLNKIGVQVFSLSYVDPIWEYFMERKCNRIDYIFFDYFRFQKFIELHVSIISQFVCALGVDKVRLIKIRRYVSYMLLHLMFEGMCINKPSQRQ